MDRLSTNSQSTISKTGNGVNKLKMGQNLTFKLNFTLKIKVDHPQKQ